MLGFHTEAQKLPNTQEISLYAPAGVKIDGKLQDWDNRLQAHNKATDIFYIIANDNDNLILVVQAVDPDVINKIYSSGFTLSIYPLNKKKEKDTVNITFPIFDKSDHFSVNLRNKPEFVPNSLASVTAADSFMNVTNMRMNAKSKTILVTGVPDLDSIISVYNDQGIKVAALFDNRMVYNCELSIKLKLLGLSADGAAKFKYNIKIHKLSPKGYSGMAATKDADGSVHIHIDPTVRFSSGYIAWLRSDTDFSGEYVLAKKP